MANADTPFGLRPVRYASGAPYNGAANPYYIPSSYGTALFIGDPVVLVGDSNDDYVEAPGIGGFPEGTLSEINKASAGDDNPIVGVIVGFGANPSNLEQKHNPASTERIALIADDPDLIFEVQDDGGGALAETNVGMNAVLIFTHSGSTYTGLSGAEMDGGTSTAPAADASYQLLIRRLVNRADNELADNAKWEVMISRHQYRAADGILGLS